MGSVSNWRNVSSSIRLINFQILELLYRQVYVPAHPTLDCSLGQDVQNSDQKSVRHHSGGNNRHHSGGAQNHGERQPGDTSTGFSEDDTETDETDHDRLTNIATGLSNMQDFFFGDGEFDPLPPFDFYSVGGVDAEDWTLPNEAFQPRHEIQAHSPPPEQQLCVSTFSPGAVANNRSSSGHLANVSENEYNTSLVAKPDALIMPTWDCTPIVVDMLQHYAVQVITLLT